MSSWTNPAPSRGASQPRVPHSLVGLLVMLSLGMFVVGCEPPAPATNGPGASDEHDHDHGDHDHDHDDHAGHDHADHEHGEGEHQHPATFAESVTALKERIAAVKVSLAGDAADEADGHVHAVGNLLVDLEGKAETLEDDVKGAVAVLLEAFDEFDQKIHANEEPLFDDIEERVETALATLDGYVEKMEKAVGGDAAEESSGSGDTGDATDGESDGT